jgi:hypothetical protein
LRKIFENGVNFDFLAHFLNQIDCVITPHAFIDKMDKLYESIKKSNFVNIRKSFKFDEIFEQLRYFKI